MNKLLSILMPKNRKGWIRIVESALAILLIFGFVMILASRNVQRPNVPESFYKTQHQILREVAQDYTLRQAVLDKNFAPITKFIDKRISPYPLNYSISICASGESCPCAAGMCPADQEIYADDIIISTDFETYDPMKLSIFTWLQPGKEITAEVCAGKTCSDMGYTCGIFTNECGDELTCGSCDIPETTGTQCISKTQLADAVTKCSCINNIKTPVPQEPLTNQRAAPVCSNQNGVCIGSTTCSNGTLATSCDTPQYQANSVSYGTTETCGDGLDNNCNGVAGDGCTTTVCPSPAGAITFSSGPSNFGGNIRYMLSSSLSTGKFRLRVYYNNDVYQTGPIHNIPTDLNAFWAELPWTTGSVITIEYSTDNFGTYLCQARKAI